MIGIANKLFVLGGLQLYDAYGIGTSNRTFQKSSKRAGPCEYKQ